MKHTIISSVKQLNVVSIIIGIVIGAALSYSVICIFSYSHSGAGNDDTHMKISGREMGSMGHTMNATNPYMMSKVTSEKQFVRDMKLHHDAAVLMSQQVLLLKNIRPEVVSLAKGIISAQTTEIRMMNDWITAWGY